MKKFLSLVLALVMTMSLVTMAGAEDFTDAADVDYKEAVEVLTATGVVSGYTDGSVRPDVALNRGQAAKIICNLILGPTAAAALPTSVAPYADVPAGSTFAGYIAYLAKEGVVSGYADGTFQPTAPLTGYAFMKMLLGVLGYDPAIEGYTGSNWAVSVAKQALANKLYKGLEGDFVGNKTVTRQEAMLYAFNTLNAKVVKYDDKGANIVIGGVTINTGASEVKVDGTYANYAAKLFGTDLVKNASAVDVFGRPATKWTYKGKTVGTFAEKATFVVTNNAKMKDVSTGLSLEAGDVRTFYATANTSKTTNNYSNAQVVTFGYYTADKTDKLADLAAPASLAGNGVTVEFFYDKDDAQDTKIVVIDEYIGQVTDVKKDGDGKRYVVVDGKNFYTEDFAKKDWVLFTVGMKATGLGIIDMVKAEKLTGKLTKSVDGTYTIGGVEYKAHAGFASTMNGFTTGTDLDFYLDSCGYIIKAGAASTTAAVENLALIYDMAPTSFGGMEAKIVYGTGKFATVTLKDALTTYQEIYSVSIESEKAKVSTPTGFATTPITSAAFTNGTVAVTGGATVAVDNNTVFVYVKTSDETTQVYTGANNAPTFSAATAYAYKKSDAKAAALVFVLDGTVSTNVSDLLYVVMKDYKVVSEYVGTTEHKYYEVKDVAGKTYKFTETATNGIAASGAYTNKGVVIYKAVTTNSNGYIDAATYADHTSYYAGAGLTIEVENGVVYGLNGTTSMAYAADAPLYIVDKDANVTVSTIADATVESPVGYAYVTNDDDNKIVALILKKA